MSAAVSSSSKSSFPAVLASLGLHGALVTAALLAGHREPERRPPARSNDVAVVDTSVDVEASSDAPAATPARPPAEVRQAAAEVDRAPAPAPASPDTLPAPRRAAPISKPKPLASVDSPARTETQGAEPSEERSPADVFDEERRRPGVRRLGYAFARAIPAAAPDAAAWRDLPLGHVGTIRIELSVDESKRLSQVRPFQTRLGEPAPPPALERLVEQVMLLLSKGQFALSTSNEPGVERLVVDVVLRNDGADEGGGDVVVQKRFSGATPARPGKAYFRYGTGHAVEATVTVLSAAARHD